MYVGQLENKWYVKLKQDRRFSVWMGSYTLMVLDISIIKLLQQCESICVFQTVACDQRMMRCGHTYYMQAEFGLCTFNFLSANINKLNHIKK